MKPDEIRKMSEDIISNGKTAQNREVERDEYDKSDQAGVSSMPCPHCGAQIGLNKSHAKDEPSEND